ncbi:MAG TPA: hypothetical protein VHY33_03160 [Thermoanaerobaculia bacterium]|nr:hypothetical protein [Thermoanaerobaculia bacterium]
MKKNFFGSLRTIDPLRLAYFDKILLVDDRIRVVSDGILLVSDGILLVADGILLVADGILLVGDGILLVDIRRDPIPDGRKPWATALTPASPTWEVRPARSHSAERHRRVTFPHGCEARNRLRRFAALRRPFRAKHFGVRWQRHRFGRAGAS